LASGPAAPDPDEGFFSHLRACAAGLAGPLAVAPLLNETASSDAALRDPPALVELQPGTVSYRIAGDFTHAAKQVEAPLAMVRFTQPLSIMKHQVSAAATPAPAAARSAFPRAISAFVWCANASPG
jgi:formylglycine-generating enzyme required for sulfatase activity